MISQAVQEQALPKKATRTPIGVAPTSKPANTRTVPANYFQTTPKRVLLKNCRSFQQGLGCTGTALFFTPIDQPPIFMII